MKFSENWLREWVNPALSTTELVEQLTMAGLEVDSVESASPDLDKVVVAHVVKLEKHPNADKLNLCQVDDGTGDLVQVICGAKNVAQGQKVAFAQVGAKLPGIAIKKAKLRDVESFGMICSAKELGLADSADGILELEESAPIGQLITDYYDLHDQLIEVDLTPNRGDCLSILGVAREVAANNQIDYQYSNNEAVKTEIDDTIKINLDHAAACPRYASRIIKNVQSNIESPLWLQEKLRRSGLRAISPVVDVTNFVMLELGQPMHGFDLDKIDSEIVVRLADENEKIELLDGNEITLRNDTLVIADKSSALAVAGIMGGQTSSVKDDTKNILLEAAFFNPVHIAGKARSYGLHTDSSHRFERGVDPQLPAKAIERATKLLQDIIGGEAGPIVIKESTENLPVNPVVTLRKEQVEKMLGIETNAQQIENYLKSLEMDFSCKDDVWQVKAPSFRFDIKIEADLVEEIGRLYGYNNIPGTSSSSYSHMDVCSESVNSIDLHKNLLVSRGYSEVVTYSFISRQHQEIFAENIKPLVLANPISSELSVMRTSLFPGLIQTLQYNLNRQQSRVRVFESGLCFIPQNNETQQDKYLAGLICGDVYEENWLPGEQVDFYHVKGDVESLLATAKHKDFEFKRSCIDYMHPGQSVDIFQNDKLVGYFGAVHPEVLKMLDISTSVYGFHLKADILMESGLPEFSELSKFPSIRRDLALLVDGNILVSELILAIKSLQITNLQEVFCFDVYKGEELTNNRKSVALGLILQDFSRTLVDKDVEKIIQRILEMLEQKYNAVLREA